MRFAPIRVLAVGVAALGVADPAASRDRAATGAPADDVADVKVSDEEGIKPCSAAVEGTFKPFGGRSIVRGRIPSRSKGRLVVIMFDSLDKARAWYDSPAYSQM
ncbi:DUF1330 domain-containing protein [Lichenibacterium ramalinae]|uniref:DUF1330 domain-containing protein n=1 Tax=Lichenibacterium ramalinae TaxID=2316527 RepID=A0A4Q2RAI3_9HYPH|nr:DUF1330 domain-containing protein [Lichenibacterium ramalinae]RYB03097.1 DUF1330 domain-containing protein [Lichenibacterium ramalinae]